MKNKYFLIKNIVSCNKCGDIIESKFTHDYQECKCGAISVDGGIEYQKLSGNEEDINFNHTIYQDTESGDFVTYDQILKKKEL